MATAAVTADLKGAAMLRRARAMAALEGALRRNRGLAGRLVPPPTGKVLAVHLHEILGGETDEYGVLLRAFTGIAYAQALEHYADRIEASDPNVTDAMIAGLSAEARAVLTT